jgi:hypothetical protein
MFVILLMKTFLHHIFKILFILYSVVIEFLIIWTETLYIFLLFCNDATVIFCISKYNSIKIQVLSSSFKHVYLSLLVNDIGNGE